tara:strand:- start:1526 stop:1792 length:267 start_codon:yes stop_codon:yes gene_type:complete
MGQVESSAIIFGTSTIPMAAMATGTPTGSKFVRDDNTLAVPSAAGANTAYAPGSFTVATGNFALHVKRLTLTTTQRATLAGDARLRIT